MFRFVRHFVISECKGNNNILNSMLFLHFLFQKVCILHVCIRKNLCIQLLRAYAKVLFISCLSLCRGGIMSALLCRLCGCLLCGSLLSALSRSLLCTLCRLLVSAESRCVVRIGGLCFCCSLFHYACL